MAKKKFYAVAIGKKPGIYETWSECQQQTKGFPCAQFKSFATREAAQEYIGESATASLPTASNDESASSEMRPAKRQRLDDSSTTTRGSVTIVVHFDGGSRGNPGLSGAGAHVVITKEQADGSASRQTVKVREYLGTKVTNNIAEYKGLVCGLKEAKIVATKFKATSKDDSIRLEVYGDSNMVIQQMNGKFQCKSPNLISLHQEAKKLVAEMKQLAPMEVTFEHVYRENNSAADALANEAMDTKRSWTTTEDDNNTDSVISPNDSKPAADKKKGGKVASKPTAQKQTAKMELIPEDEKVRHDQLQQRFNQVSALACKSESSYMHFMTMLAHEENHLRSPENRNKKRARK